MLIGIGCLPKTTQTIPRDLTDAQVSDMLLRVVVDEHSHSLEEHPEDAYRIWDCFNQNGAVAQFQIFKNERYLRVCDLGNGEIGFQIVDRVGKVFKERTAYIKENCNCLGDVFKYASRKGYVRFTGPIQ